MPSRGGENRARRQRARYFMLDTINAFVEAVGTSSLQERIAAA